MDRPENPHNEHSDGECFCEDAFEEGVDAAYALIWKLAEESPTKTFTFDTNTINIFGVKRGL